MSKNEQNTYEILKILETMTPDEINRTRQEYFKCHSDLTDRVKDYINTLCKVALEIAAV